MENGIIWRYMDTSRFLSLLEESALYFPNTLSFDDPFEGSVPIRNVENRISTLRDEFESQAPFKRFYEALTQQSGIIFPDPKGFVESQVKAKIALREKLIDEHQDKERAVKAWVAELNFDSINYYWQRQNVFINCWHESDCESAAMWKLYSNNDHSVCMRSDISTLRECLGEGITVERVTYIDFTKDTIPELEENPTSLFALHKYKRNSFSHEKEVRAMYVSMAHLEKSGTIRYGMPLKKLGELKRVDLNTLIREVYVAPDSPSWYLSLIEKVKLRYGLNANIHRSSLLADPVY